MLLVPHGHGDHYGALYDEWEMIVRQKDNEDNSIIPIAYESYEDTIGFDIYGFPEIGGIYDDQSVRSVITNWYPNDVWNSLGDGLSMMVTLTPGHFQDWGSAVFDVEVQEDMEDAKLTYEYAPTAKMLILKVMYAPIVIMNRAIISCLLTWAVMVSTDWTALQTQVTEERHL